MCEFHSVFLRTAAGVRNTKEALERLINVPFEQFENYEIFNGRFLGVTVEVEWMDEDLNQTVVRFNDEYIPLSTYDLEIKNWYDEHFFIRDHQAQWTRSIATVLADALCRNLSCETLAVCLDYNSAFAKHMPFEERFMNQ